MRVDLPRVHAATLAHELQQPLGAPALPGRPGPTASGRPRMHQGLERAGDETVVDEEILLDRERRVAPLEIARAIIPHAMAQGQVLCPRRRANRVCLDETLPLERMLQARRRIEAASDGEAPEIV